MAAFTARQRLELLEEGEKTERCGGPGGRLTVFRRELRLPADFPEARQLEADFKAISLTCDLVDSLLADEAPPDSLPPMHARLASLAEAKRRAFGDQRQNYARCKVMCASRALAWATDKTDLAALRVMMSAYPRLRGLAGCQPADVYACFVINTACSLARSQRFELTGHVNYVPALGPEEMRQVHGWWHVFWTNFDKRGRRGSVCRDSVRRGVAELDSALGRWAHEAVFPQQYPCWDYEAPSDGTLVRTCNSTFDLFSHLTAKPGGEAYQFDNFTDEYVQKGLPACLVELGPSEDPPGCCICLDRHDDCSYIMLACGHRFGVSCGLPWIKVKGHGCPVCRGPARTYRVVVYKRAPSGSEGEEEEPVRENL